MQLHLFDSTTRRELERTEHGGDVRRHERKLERPVSTRRPMHVCLHSKRARGAWSLLRHERAVGDALRVCARRTGVRVYEFANVGSHLHLLVRSRRRESFRSFLRSFAGIVARRVTGARRGHALSGGRFWSVLAWSRVVSWGRDCMTVRHYIFRNRLEAAQGPGVRRAFELGPSPRKEPPSSMRAPRSDESPATAKAGSDRRQSVRADRMQHDPRGSPTRVEP